MSLLDAYVEGLILYTSTLSLYNLYLHPLRIYPGPPLYALSDFPTIISKLFGEQVFSYAALHAKYGPVVRVGPNTLSYISSQAWNDIYGGATPLPKHPRDYGVKSIGEHIIIAGDANHTRFRTIMANAFSDRALKAQESLIRGYVDLLIQRLRESAGRGEKTDMVRWYNFTLFDIIGDLTFGEPFDCLMHGKYHAWISKIFDSLKIVNFTICTMYFPLLNKALMMLAPPAVQRMQQEHIGLVKEKVKRRVERKTDRPDFLGLILAANEAEGEGKRRGMTYEELESNSEIFIVAGSETTATALSGATYYLTKNPRVMQKLAQEIRSSFKSEEDITFTSVGGLKYLQAVQEEAMRMYPAVPISLPRITPPQGAIICGKFVPGGTGISVQQWSAHHSELNFKNPSQFVPERWLGDPEYESDDRDAFHPFSIGPKNCIGRNLAYLEMRLILARVLWNFDIQLMPESDGWVNEQKVYILWEKIPLYVKLKEIARG